MLARISHIVAVMPIASACLHDLIESGIRLSWEESVALVQGVCALAAGAMPRSERVNPSVEFAITSEGKVAATSGTPPLLSASDLALFLGELLPAVGDREHERPPAGVRFAIARAGGLVEAPPIASLRQLSTSLARFERRDRTELLRGVFDRFRAIAERRRPERRRTADLPPDEVRRLLREADRRAFLALSHAGDTDRPAAPTPDMLRRFLREADQRAFELSRRVLATPSARGPRAPLANAAAPVARSRSIVGAGPIGATLRPRRLRTALAVLTLPIAAFVVAERYSGPLVSTFRPASPDASSARASRTQPAGGGGPVNGAPRTAAPDSSSSDSQYVGTSGNATRTRPPASPDARMIRVLRVPARAAFSPSFAGRGSDILFDVDQGTGSAVMEADAARSQPRPELLIDGGARNYHPHASPDNRTIAFDSDRDGVRGVYLANRDGTNVRRVSGPGYAAVPSWSPDGRRLTFVKAEPGRSKVWNIWCLDMATGRMSRLTSYRYGQPWGASWFPDNHRICYAHEDRLVVLDLATGQSRSWSSPQPGRLVRTPAVSPDGRRVMFQVQRDGAWMRDLAEGTVRRVLADRSAEEFAWSPDGREVAFHSRRNGEWAVWFMRLQ